MEVKETGIALADPNEFRENIYIRSFDEFGRTLKETEFHNIIPKVGREKLAIRMGNASTQGHWTDLELGTSNQAPASTDTGVVAAILSGGLQRAAASFSAISNGAGENSTCQWSLTFTKTSAGSVTVEEVAIMNAQNSCLARSLTGSHAIAQNGGITIIHKVPLS